MTRKQKAIEAFTNYAKSAITVAQYHGFSNKKNHGIKFMVKETFTLSENHDNHQWSNTIITWSEVAVKSFGFKSKQNQVTKSWSEQVSIHGEKFCQITGIDECKYFLNSLSTRTQSPACVKDTHSQQCYEAQKATGLYILDNEWVW